MTAVLIRDKLILLVICLAFYLPGSASIYAVVPLIIAITAGAINSWLIRPEHRAIVLCGFTILCIIEPQLIYFLPVVSFDLFADKLMWLIPITLLPLVWHRGQFSWETAAQWVLLMLLAWLLKSRGISLEKALQTVNSLQDSNREKTIQFEQRNKELLEKQDYEINLATLNERNRIAREIHDHVGHLLTRAILQVGALQTICRDDEGLKEQLAVLQSTLNDSMNEIRHSLHDLHDAAIDLEVEIRAVIRSFSFCPVILTYDAIVRPDQKTIFTFLAIVREALSNIARHSGATRVDITVREHPGFYQLIIRDNGSGGQGRMADGPLDLDSLMGDTASGIGLKNMVERVRGLNGQINISRERGFVIFISVPRKDISRQAGS
jgi:signal transduction histidine kinase